MIAAAARPQDLLKFFADTNYIDDTALTVEEKRSEAVDEKTALRDNEQAGIEIVYDTHSNGDMETTIDDYEKQAGDSVIDALGREASL